MPYLLGIDTFLGKSRICLFLVFLLNINVFAQETKGCNNIKEIASMTNSKMVCFSQKYCYTLLVEKDLINVNKISVESSEELVFILKTSLKAENIQQICVLYDSILLISGFDVLFIYNLSTLTEQKIKLPGEYNKLLPAKDGVFLSADGSNKNFKEIEVLFYSITLNKFTPISNLKLESYLQFLGMTANKNMHSSYLNNYVHLNPILNNVTLIKQDSIGKWESHVFKINKATDRLQLDKYLVAANKLKNRNTSDNMNHYFYTEDKLPMFSNVQMLDEQTIGLLYTIRDSMDNIRETLYFYHLNYDNSQLELLNDSIVFQFGSIAFGKSIENTETVYDCHNTLHSLYFGSFKFINNYLLYYGRIVPASCIGKSRLDCIRAKYDPVRGYAKYNLKDYINFHF